MKNTFLIILLGMIQWGCSTLPADPPPRPLVSFDELASEISVARVEHRRAAAHAEAEPIATP